MKNPAAHPQHSEPTPPAAHRRRARYAGKHPRRFEDKYKELQKNPETIAQVIASGKTPAGAHLPVMLPEVLDALRPEPGSVAVDCTLGHGGHTRGILHRILPGGRLLALDTDPLELPRTEAALRAEGFGEDVLLTRKSNFAGLPAALAASGISRADVILADLGVSSMQLDNPARGFTMKSAGPLDMRMNPARGLAASQWLERVRPAELEATLADNADEPDAALLARILAGGTFLTTTDLAAAIRNALPNRLPLEREKAVRRVFQAVRIAVNEEFSALEALLRALPLCLNPGGRVAILSFHSGEDRRVKKAFQTAFREGRFTAISQDVIRASPDECRANPRATPAKLRWARI
jgi:16S rRNA (cytosine1402-N4)-methyltransferase